MRTVIFISLLVTLVGCATDQNIRCDERLEPINQTVATPYKFGVQKQGARP
jgi:hypothetical protein